MSVFNVELKKVVDDSYDIEMGYRLEDQLGRGFRDRSSGKNQEVCRDHGFNVLDLYAKPISEKLSKAGFKVELFVFPAGEKVRPDRRRRRLKMPCWKKGSAEIVL